MPFAAEICCENVQSIIYVQMCLTETYSKKEERKWGIFVR